MDSSEMKLDATIYTSGKNLFVITKSLSNIGKKVEILLRDPIRVQFTAISPYNTHAISITQLFSLDPMSNIVNDATQYKGDWNSVSYLCNTSMLHAVAVEVKDIDNIVLKFGIKDGIKHILIFATDNFGIDQEYDLEMEDANTNRLRAFNITNTLITHPCACFSNEIIPKILRFMQKSKNDGTIFSYENKNNTEYLKLTKIFDDAYNMVSELHIPVEYTNSTQFRTKYDSKLLALIAKTIKLYNPKSMKIYIGSDYPILFELNTQHAASVEIILAPRVEK